MKKLLLVTAFFLFNIDYKMTDYASKSLDLTLEYLDYGSLSFDNNEI